VFLLKFFVVSPEKNGKFYYFKLQIRLNFAIFLGKFHRFLLHNFFLIKNPDYEPKPGTKDYTS